MFDDIDEKKGPPPVSRDSADRVLLYAIWTRDAAQMLPVPEAWSVLFARHPTDARLLLLSTYEEAVEKAGEWSPTLFLDAVKRVLDVAGGHLNPEVRDLLAVVEDDLHPLAEADSARLDRIRERVGARFRLGDATAARKRLARLAADVVRELHDRTLGGRPLVDAPPRGSASMPVASVSWQEALASATAPKRAYSAEVRASVGDVVEHPKFGVGVVVATEPGRAQILFESGPRKLVCG